MWSLTIAFVILTSIVITVSHSGWENLPKNERSTQKLTTGEAFSITLKSLCQIGKCYFESQKESPDMAKGFSLLFKKFLDVGIYNLAFTF